MGWYFLWGPFRGGSSVKALHIRASRPRDVIRFLYVQVVLVDARSHSFVREGSHCEFLLTSFDSSWGVLENPRHSLPPNTTCRYHFQGRRHETVWLSFVKYHAASADPASYELGAECNARLRIWDGRIATNTGSPRQQVSTHAWNWTVPGVTVK
jgi:hypothetical protein